MNLRHHKTYCGAVMAGIALMAAVGRGGELVNPRHIHMRQLLENAMGYINPEHGLFDPVSGYPVEGWNDDARAGLYLRDFTQLTTLGEWLELLGDIAAGYVDQPYLSRTEALRRLERVVDSLVHDQHDPDLSDRGLLSNFLAFGKDRRIGPLTSDAYQREFVVAFGEAEGSAIWQALKSKGWLKAWRDDKQAEIKRITGYGHDGFSDALAPYAETGKKNQIMGILDRRVVQIVYGDNANLSASVAKTIGALLHPSVRSEPAAQRIRERLESFLEAQRPGYQFLYDSERGLFRFGWNATHHQFLGWGDAGDVWQTTYADYLVNEFRGPMKFVVIRYGFPDDPLRYQAFKIKSHPMKKGNDLYTLVAWEGSAFQTMGLSLFMGERSIPGWRAVLENAVRINLDYSRAHRLPGFLSEAYSGNGIEYSGKIGVPDIAVVNDARITNAPSLYTLGVAYEILPGEVESFLGDYWPEISSLFTTHGPWEGFNITLRQPVECQTAVHVMSLILGGVGVGSENMGRYLEHRKLTAALRRVYPGGDRVNLLIPEVQTAVWSPDGSAIELIRGKKLFRLKGKQVQKGAVTWMLSSPPEGVSFSNGELLIRYRNRGGDIPVVVSLERPSQVGRGVSQELFTRFRHAAYWAREIRIPLPATPGLLGIQKVTLLVGSGEVRKVDFELSGFAFEPYEKH